MHELQIRLPRSTVREVTRLFIPEDVPEGSVIELSISLVSENINVRELSGYLSLIDGFYARLYPEGIYAYGHRKEEQLKFSGMRSGSIETVIEEVLSVVTSPHRLVLLYLLMKYLPNIIKSSAEAVKNLAGAYEDYQKGSQIREERENRRRLREAVRDEVHLQQLDHNRVDQLVKLLDSFYAVELRRLPRAIQLAQKNVKGIRLNIRKKS